MQVAKSFCTPGVAVDLPFFMRIHTLFLWFCPPLICALTLRIFPGDTLAKIVGKIADFVAHRLIIEIMQAADNVLRWHG